MGNAADTIHQDNSVWLTVLSNVPALINNMETYMTMVLWEVSDESTRKIFGAIEQKYGKIIKFSILSWWQTNAVYRIDIWDNIYVLKVWSDLDREEKFYRDSAVDEYFPKLHNVFSVGDRKWLLLEYKSGVNGKEVVDNIWNWETIGTELGSALRIIHNRNLHQVDVAERDWAVRSMIDYLSWGNTQEDLEKLWICFNSCNLPLVHLHGDFSPHNCLFVKINDSDYRVSAIFDPSGRVNMWFSEFDIFYALNNRWIRDKDAFKKWFIQGYGEVDFNSEIYRAIEKIFSNYLKMLYQHI